MEALIRLMADFHPFFDVHPVSANGYWFLHVDAHADMIDPTQRRIQTRALDQRLKDMQAGFLVLHTTSGVPHSSFEQFMRWLQRQPLEHVIHPRTEQKQRVREKIALYFTRGHYTEAMRLVDEYVGLIHAAESLARFQHHHGPTFSENDLLRLLERFSDFRNQRTGGTLPPSRQVNADAIAALLHRELGLKLSPSDPEKLILARVDAFKQHHQVPLSFNPTGLSGTNFHAFLGVDHPDTARDARLLASDLKAFFRLHQLPVR